MDFYTRYNPPPSPCEKVVGESMASQDAKRECDINYILARVGLGDIALTAPKAIYADIADVPADYQEIANRLIDADQRFASLPAKVRDKFGSDPSRLFAFLADKSNLDEAIELGLIARPPKPSEPSEPSKPSEPSEPAGSAA